jgi:hypothetical protein
LTLNGATELAYVALSFAGGGINNFLSGGAVIAFFVAFAGFPPLSIFFTAVFLTGTAAPPAFGAVAFFTAVP